MILDLNTPLGARVLRSQGRIESGQLANMRTYLRNETVHVRILGEDRTLCGRSLRHAGQWAWQFIHRGHVGTSLPSGSYPGERHACQICTKNPVVQATAAVVNARRRAIADTRSLVIQGGTL